MLTSFQLFHGNQGRLEGFDLLRFLRNSGILANFTFYSPVGVIVQPRLHASESEILGPRQRELNKDGVCVVGSVANISGFAVQKVELLIKMEYVLSKCSKYLLFP